MLGVLAPLLSLAGVEVTEITDKVKRQATAWGLIGAFGLVFITFLLVALNSALAIAYGPVIAPLIIAVVAAVIALAVFLVLHMQNNAAAKREAERKRSAETSALVTTAIVTAMPLIFKSTLLREIGLPAGAAIASALLLRKGGPINRNPEP